MIRVLFLIMLLVVNVTASAHAENTVAFGENEYLVTEIVVAKSSSARMARFHVGNPGILNKHIYLPAGTLLFLLDHYERDPRKYQLAVSEHGMPLYVLPRLNYFPATRFSGMPGEYAAIPREKLVLQTNTYGEITLTPSEVYTMDFLDYPNIAISIGKAKMQKRYTEDEIVPASEEHFAIVTLPIDQGATVPTATQIYDLESALDDLVASISERDRSKLNKFTDYARGRFVSTKDCEQEINYGVGIEGELAAEFDAWLSPVDVQFALSGNFNATRKHPIGTEFVIERYEIGETIYELKNEGVAADCVNMDEKRRIRIAAERYGAQLNSQDASDMQLRTDPKGLIIYTCRDEYLEIEKTLHNQELPIEAARLMISRFTIFEDVVDAARCVEN